MPTFNYQAVNSKNQRQTGTIIADSAQQARQFLREQQLFPIEINLLERKSAKQTWLSRRFKPLDIALLTRQLGSLLTAGMPLAEALKGLSEQAETPKLQHLVNQVQADVLSGQSLANALRSHPQAFSDLYCATIAAGEQTGELATVLSELAEYLESSHQTRQRITNAMIYPSLMAIIALGIISFLLIYVVPKIMTIFQDTGQDLPIATKILLSLSQHLSQYTWAYLLLFLLLILLFKKLNTYLHWREIFNHFYLKIPWLGKSLKTINIARYCHTLGVLLQAGVPILHAMHVSTSLITNIPMARALKTAETNVGEGTGLYVSLRQTNLFPPLILHLINSGEKSGNLSNTLTHISNQLNDDINRLTQTLVSLFEPLIIIVMGSVVLFIVLAILLPIFALNTLIS